MTVIVSLKGVQGTNEYEAGEKLKSIFERDFGKKANGRILIKTSTNLIGTEVKDIDLLVIGVFEPSNRLQAQLTSRLYDLGTNRTRDEEPKRRTVKFNSFCFCIELKSHPAEDVFVDGNDIFVPYNGRPSNVTDQSEKQKLSVRLFLESRVSKGFFVCNFIWLANVKRAQLSQLLGDKAVTTYTHNVLHGDCHGFDLLQLAVMQRPPIENQFGTYSSAVPKDEDGTLLGDVEKALDLFEEVRRNVGKLTRQQLERIMSELLGEQKYAQEIGNKLIVFSGRAGTGKTIKLLRVAFDLARNQAKRCLILTYNHALASDMRRAIHLTGISDGYDVSTVSVSTLDRYFYNLLDALELLRPNLGYLQSQDQRDLYISELWEYINSGAVTEDDLQKMAASQLNWDYVLVDEGQDWQGEEKNILFRLFGSKHMIVADGVDQMIRGRKKCDWAEGIEAYKPPAEKRCLRQKKNIASFVNAYAEKMNLQWKLEPREEFSGGKVIIIVGDYTPDIHKALYATCVESGNLAYEMLLLVPPNLVVKQEINADDTETPSANTKVPRVSKRSVLIDRFSGSGVKFWDGTNRDIRQEYPVNLEEHRLLQYDSCRGLEGWVVVCVEFDRFVEYKTNTYAPPDEAQQSLALFSPKEKAQEYAHLWSLIPLTRAIDTLVITLTNDNSHVAGALRALHEAFPDYIEWHS